MLCILYNLLFIILIRYLPTFITILEFFLCIECESIEINIYIPTCILFFVPIIKYKNKLVKYIAQYIKIIQIVKQNMKYYNIIKCNKQ